MIGTAVVTDPVRVLATGQEGRVVGCFDRTASSVLVLLDAGGVRDFSPSELGSHRGSSGPAPDGIAYLRTRRPAAA